MHDSGPAVAGWYEDPATGGTRYWDGHRWSGDARPPRRAFAAKAHYGSQGWSAVALGVITVFLAAMSLSEGSGAGFFIIAVLIGVGMVAAGTYLVRGQGATTEEVEAALEQHRKRAKAQRRTGNVAGIAARVLGMGVAPKGDGLDQAVQVHAAQVNAIANPETAKALEKLNHLVYARLMTREEYGLAKERLLGAPQQDDAVEHITRLGELHRSGVLSDVEFAAAKARILKL